MTITTTRTELKAKLQSLASDPRTDVAAEAQRLLDHITYHLEESELTQEQKDTRADQVIDRTNATIGVRALNLAGDYLLSNWGRLAP